LSHEKWVNTYYLHEISNQTAHSIPNLTKPPLLKHHYSDSRGLRFFTTLVIFPRKCETNNQHTSRFFALPDVYRFGFNGKELDTEGMGGGSSTYDYGFRIYNAALGKFLSVDPLYKDYPDLTTFQFASNCPLSCIDLDGLEAKLSTFGAGLGSHPDGTKNPKEKHEAQFKREAAMDVVWKNAENAYSVNTGEKLLSVLSQATKNEGSIEYLSIFSHASNVNIILDNGQYGKHSVGTNDWSGYSRMSTDQLFSNSEIKFAPNALVVFGGCNAGRRTGTKDVRQPGSIARNITEKYGVATIGADGSTYPTKGNKRKADFNFYLFYKDESNTVQQVGLGKILDDSAIKAAKAILETLNQPKDATNTESENGASPSDAE